MGLDQAEEGMEVGTPLSQDRYCMYGVTTGIESVVFRLVQNALKSACFSIKASKIVWVNASDTVSGVGYSTAPRSYPQTLHSETAEFACARIVFVIVA